MKKAIWSGAAAGLVVTAAAVVAAVAGGGAAMAAEGQDVQSSLVEDYAYPWAEQVWTEHGLRVFDGDGHVALVESRPAGGCSDGLVQVLALEGQRNVYFCFATSGARGFLTMELPGAFMVRAADDAVQATATIAGKDAPVVVRVPANDVKKIAIDENANPEGVLVELRFGSW